MSDTTATLDLTELTLEQMVKVLIRENREARREVAQAQAENQQAAQQWMPALFGAVNELAKTVAACAADIQHVRSLIDSEIAAENEQFYADASNLGDDEDCPCCDDPWEDEPDDDEEYADEPVCDDGPCCNPAERGNRTDAAVNVTQVIVPAPESPESVAEQVSEAIIARVEPLSDQDYYGNADRCEDDSCEMCGVGPCNDEGCCRRGESGDDSE